MYSLLGLLFSLQELSLSSDFVTVVVVVEGIEGVGDEIPFTLLLVLVSLSDSFDF